MPRRILVVGSGPTARRAAETLRGAGHEAFPHVVIETVAIATPGEVRAAIARLPAGGLMLFSSRAAVRHAGDLAGAALRGRRAGVQGPGTASEAHAAGIAIAFEAPVHTAEGMLEAIEAFAPAPGPGFLLFMAERGRGVLERGLRDGGYAVEPLTLYRTEEVPAGAREALPAGRLDVVVFTSPSAVRAYLAAEALPPGAMLVAMGSTTERELRRAGLEAGGAPDDYSVDGLVTWLQTMGGPES